MQKNDADIYRNRLREYLHHKGIEIDDTKTPPLLRCINPVHADNNPSAILYENSSRKSDYIHCPVCAVSWGIYDAAGLITGNSDFKDNFNEVEKYFTVETAESTDKKENSYVLVDENDGKTIYTKDNVLNIAKNYGPIVNTWKYFENGKIAALDIRFEKENKKTVLTFWYDGKRLQSKNPPKLIYNIDEIVSTDKPVLIVEGCKCAEIARVLDSFVPCSWNGGSSRSKFINWSLLKDKEVFILHDDDDAGIKAAKNIQQQLKQAKIISPPEGIRDIKQKGGDIEEILQIMSAEELTDYIREFQSETGIDSIHGSFEIPHPKDNEIQEDIPVSDGGFPFSILGLSDDGKAYFLDEKKNLVSYQLDSLNKIKLLRLADYSWWLMEYKFEGKMSWDKAINDVIQDSLQKQFSMDSIRGRGAWKDKNGGFVYHDGITTTGKIDDNILYLKKSKKDIGIHNESIDVSLLASMRKSVFDLSFQSPVDAVRSLGWATLAPFGGALSWRPAFYLTGPTKSGKSTIVNFIIKKLGCPHVLDATESTPAGVRGGIQNDSAAVIFEESDDDTPRKREKKNDLLSLMRSSTSDDAPDAWKGTKDGKNVSYKMQNMFGFVAISTSIDSGADENRLMYINMIAKIDKEWPQKKKALIEAFKEENCAAIRARTWKNLDKIISMIPDVSRMIQDLTMEDYRFCDSEAAILSAYMAVWKNIFDVNSVECSNLINEFYANQEKREIRDQTEDMLDLIMDERIILYNSREEYTIREIISALHNDSVGNSDEIILSDSLKYEMMKTIERYGIGYKTDLNQIVIHNNHKEIKKIIGKGSGYSREFKRHNFCINSNGRARVGGILRAVSIFDVFGFIEVDSPDSPVQIDMEYETVVHN